MILENKKIQLGSGYESGKLFFAAFDCDKILRKVEFCKEDAPFEREAETPVNVHQIESAATWKLKVWKYLAKAWKLRLKPWHNM